MASAVREKVLATMAKSEARVSADVRDAIMRRGVKNLKEYGYPAASLKNIISDQIYSAFFRTMLEDNRGKGFDEAIGALIEEIDSAKAAKSK